MAKMLFAHIRERLPHEAAISETKRTLMAVVVEVERSQRDRVNAALDEVRPAIARDGGEVWLVRVEDGVAYVQMVGACGGCSMVESTLRGAIERIVLERCPDVIRVDAI